MAQHTIKRMGLILIPLVLLVFCYIVRQSVPFSFGESLDYWHFIHRLKTSDKHDAEGVFINMAYDNALCDFHPYTDADGERIDLYKGNVCITDRKALIDLLTSIKNNNSYKYVILDIRFEEGTNTPYDSTLFNLIASMRDIVIPSHQGMILGPQKLQPISALADSRSTISNIGFTKMQFLQRNGESIPLKLYTDLTGNSIKKVGPFYFDKGRLCANSLFIHIPDFQTDKTQRPYYDYGPEIATEKGYFSSEERFKDKIIVIGDFVNDCTGTYNGIQANPRLLYLSSSALLGGYHLYSIWFILTVYFIYLLATVYVLYGHRWTLTKWLEKHKVLYFLFNLIIFNNIFYLIGAGIFVATSYSISTFIPSTAFSVLRSFSDIWNK